MLRHPARIGGVAQNFGDGARRPIAKVPPHRLLAVQPRVVRRGVGDALVGERAGDRPIGAARKAHIVDTPHDVCRLLVDDCRALLVRSRLVAVGVRPVGVLALLPVGFQNGADLLGSIRRVPLVEHVHDGHHIHARARSVRRVHVVRKGDKADAVGGEDIVDILPHLNVISAEARKIFYNDGIDLALFGIVQKPFDGGALEVGARPAVVDILVHDGAAVFLGILFEHYALVFDGHTLARLLVVARKAHVKSRSIQLFLL